MNPILLANGMYTPRPTLEDDLADIDDRIAALHQRAERIADMIKIRDTERYQANRAYRRSFGPLEEDTSPTFADAVAGQAGARYRAGCSAFGTAACNPYPEDSTAFSDWQRGYNGAKADFYEE